VKLKGVEQMKLIIVLLLIFLLNNIANAMTQTKEIPDSLRSKLDSLVIDNYLIPESELDSLLLIYPESDYLLAQKIYVLFEDDENSVEALRIIKDIKNPGTYVLSEIAFYNYAIQTDNKNAELMWKESIARDKRHLNWLVRMRYAQFFGEYQLSGMQNRIDLADKYYLEALEISPNNPRVLLSWARTYLLNVGFVLERQDLVDKASRMLKMVSMDYDPASRNTVEGLYWAAIDNPQMAKLYFHKALTIDSNFIDAVILYSELEIRRGNYLTAKQFLEHHLEKHPNNLDITFDYASVLLYLKEYKNAILFFNKSLSLDNDPIGRSFTKISISEAYIGLHQFDKAEGELLDALKENANSKVYTYLLLLHVLMKRNVDKELKEFYKNFPSESDDNYLHFVFSNYSRKVPKK
jgi:tetratricopeptide (TPR) repeat protein